MELVWRRMGIGEERFFKIKRNREKRINSIPNDRG